VIAHPVAVLEYFARLRSSGRPTMRPFLMRLGALRGSSRCAVGAEASKSKHASIAKLRESQLVKSIVDVLATPSGSPSARTLPF